MTATDRDERDTLHTKCKYRILNQDRVSSQYSRLFDIDGDTGLITLASPGLDREVIFKWKASIFLLLV